MKEKKIKIEIKNSITGQILFEYEKVNNTVRDTVIEAVKNGAYLRGAYLRGADLSGADLRGADLSGADLRGADLSCAYLRGADLSGADLRDADLSGAYLSGAYLSGAYLRGAYLSGAYLSGAYLRGADLSGADLRDADLSGADLRDADLSGAKNIPFIPSTCPSDGEFIGWKKVKDVELEEDFLVKLLILEDSKRSSSNGRKCRCDKAKVLGIYKIADLTTEVDEVINTNFVQTVYKVGEIVEADSFDENRFKECSHGIHFFIEKQEAIDYYV